MYSDGLIHVVVEGKAYVHSVCIFISLYKLKLKQEKQKCLWQCEFSFYCVETSDKTMEHKFKVELCKLLTRF
jgi:hypothetical protein